MRLLQQTGRYYFWFSVLIFFLVGGILLLALRIVIEYETDERLRDAREVLQLQFAKLDSLPPVIVFSSDVIELSPLKEFSKYELYSDTLHWNKIDIEYEPYRKYTYHQYINDRPYNIAINQSKLETEGLMSTTIITVLCILGLFLLAINLFNRYLSLRIWRPFYETIRQIKGFTFEKEHPLTFPDTRIEEFKILHQAIEQMTTKVLSDYRSLKQFTENASHEIQTPLAIIKSKTELLMQKDPIDHYEQQAIEQIRNATHRLSKLNQALLLLIRIENRQYMNTRQLNLRVLIENKLDQLEPLISAKNLKVYTELEEVMRPMDSTLAEVLLNNLLGNAIKHNLPEGMIEVLLDEKQLLIRNTGKPLEVPPEQLFDRFRKGEDAAPSTGLGLAIVKEICANYHFKVRYAYEEGLHGLFIVF